MNDELFERYLTGEMDATQKEAFEASLLESSELAEEFRTYHLALVAIERGGDEGLKDQLIQRGEERLNSQSRSSYLKWILPLTAAAAAIVLLFLIKPWAPPQLTPGELFAAHYKTPEGPSIRGEGDGLDPRWNAGILAYNAQDFATAESNLEPLLEEDFPRKAQCLFYLGISELEIGAPDEALSHLLDERLRNNPTLPNADWYAAMAYLKKGDLGSGDPVNGDQGDGELGSTDLEKAQALLQSISIKEGHNFQEEAKSILSQLPNSSED